VLYAMIAAVNPAGGSGPVGLYKSSDGGAHWALRTRIPGVAGPQGDTSATADPRPLGRIGGGDLPPIVLDPKNENVIYSASIVMWRSEDGGDSWSAVRGSPGGDDYQRIWSIRTIPTDPCVSDQGAVISSNRGASWSNWYTQPTAAVYHVTADNAFPYRVCSGQQDSGSICVASRSDDGEITFHDWHPANIQEYGIAAPDPRDPDVVFGSARRGVSRYDRRSGQTAQVGPDSAARGDKFGRNVRTMPLIWSPLNPNVLYYTSNVVWKSVDHAHTWTRISPDLARQTWPIPASVGKYATAVSPTPRGAITALSPSPRSSAVLWAATDDGNIQVTTNGGATWRNVTPRPSSHGRGSSTSKRGTSIRARRTPPRIRCGSTTCIRISGAHTTAAGHGPRSTPASPQRRRQFDSRGSARSRAAVCRDRRAGLGVVRRRRELAVAATEHAGHFGARHPGQG